MENLDVRANDSNQNLEERNKSIQEKLEEVLTVNSDNSGSFVEWKPEYLEILNEVLAQDTVFF